MTRLQTMKQALDALKLVGDSLVPDYGSGHYAVQRSDKPAVDSAITILDAAVAETEKLRDRVYDSIDSERFYQDRKWGSVQDRPHEVGGWLLLMRKLLTDAEAAWATSNNDYKALNDLRKVLAVGVACAEQHGLPGRSLTQPVSERMRKS